ncbi:hexitol phosphatase HxpB [Myroides sp. LJL119]
MKDTVIFDMDGVLLDSEKLWRQSEQEILTSLGVAYNLAQANQIKGQTIQQIVQFWYNIRPWQGPCVEQVASMISNRVIQLIQQQAVPSPGLLDVFEFLKKNNIKIGLASNSSSQIIQYTLESLKITPYFDQIVSAEQVDNPKPEPDVYLQCAKLLGSKVKNCIVIEDSYTGAKAGKSANMEVILFGENHEVKNAKFDFVDFKITSLHQVYTDLDKLFIISNFH